MGAGQSKKAQSKQCFEDKISSPCRKNAVDAFEETPTDFTFLCKKKRNKTMANERPQRENFVPRKKFS
jgi:hypothetical protein